MFGIQRHDPSAPSGSTGAGAAADGLSDMARKIEERKRKRNATEAGIADTSAPAAAAAAAPASASTGEWQPAPGESPADREKRMKREKRARMGLDPGYGGGGGGGGGGTAPAAAPAPATTSTGEWQPAPGESPAEREKRIKREKRAERLGLDSGAGAGGYGPAASSYMPPPTSFPSSYAAPSFDSTPAEPSSGVGMALHPSRQAAVEEEQASKKRKVQAKTPARLRYLKKKAERAKGKKAGLPNAGAGNPNKLSKKAKAKLAEAERRKEAGEPLSSEGEGEEGEDSSSEDGGEDKARAEEKRLEILRKKEERKVKREAKKAEARRLKAEILAAGGDVTAAPTPKPKPVPAPKPAPVVVAPIPEPIVDEPTPEQAAAALEAIAEEEARLARKEAKRSKREQRRLAPSTLIPTDNTTPRAGSPTPDVDLPPINPEAEEEKKEKEEPAPLFRLPGATRPVAPSKKTLSDLNVHESVRNKRVVDPELKLGLGQENGGLGLSERARKRLGDMGVTEAFAVQTAVLPLLLPSGQPTTLYAPFHPPQDVCVSAPTGSGKTLAYVVPIVETLAPRIVTRLRALILLPTRDLVAQVRETFEQFAKGTGLKVGTATGQHSFAQEQVQLVGENLGADVPGGSSQIDILIATPGRLMDHLRQTRGFSLQHLRYLVVDEADRLLTQSFHDWLPSILGALKPTSASLVVEQEKENLALLTSASAETSSSALAPEWWDAEGKDERGVQSELELESRMGGSCQKLLFSATLSRDPAKIDALHLHRPVYISVEDALDPHAEDEGVEDVDAEGRFTFPSGLTEHMIVSPSTHKPLYLLHLLHTLKLDSALCFTKSVEAATRLAKLVEFFEEAYASVVEAGEEKQEERKKVVVKAYSSELPAGERTRLLQQFKKGEVQMLICSDLIARGIDLPAVSHVISYDIPADARKYVHRVGRTARAGRKGEGWSLVEDREVAPFKSMMQGAQHWAKIGRVRVKDREVEGFMESYQTALEKLRAHFATGQAKKDA